MKHYLVLALAGFLITSQKADSKTTSADLILTNGAVYTVNEKQPWAQAVAVSKGEIVAVGTNQEILSLAGKGTKQQNLKGKMLLPGFIDSHAHPVMGGAYMRSLSLDSFATPEHWVKQLAEFSAQNPNERVLFGYGFLASAFGPQGPTSAMLDKVVTDRPVIIMDEGFHGAWANTKAMKILGVNQDTPDPVPEFSYYKRDEHGRPTGYLLEGTATAAIEKLEVITAESIALGTSDVIELMNRYGITSVFDAGALDVDSLQLEVLEKLTKQGK